ncbi:MAG: hypothetical protein HY902_05325 [Deltaproteobacteria bacterium]|nr:hypothetical protein [Deltaproteobacteria bacterium]
MTLTRPLPCAMRFGAAVPLASLLLCAASWLAPSAHAAEAIAPLPANAATTFWGSPEDAEPEKRHTFKAENEGQHFLYCDELRLDLFEPALRNLGGGYVGVGSDQAYLFIGWMRPQLAWLSDYDGLVVRIHRIYHAFFAEADNPQAFVALWRDAKKGRAVIEERLAGDPELPRLLRLYNVQRPYVLRRLGFVIWRAGKAKVPTFVTSADDYRYVRELIAARRVRPMLGNLLSDKGLRGIGEASRSLGVPIRAFYVSNAEQYWAYTANYRANVSALHFDAQSWIVRTNASKPSNGDYRYFLEPAQRFVAELADPKVKSVGQVAPMVGIDDPHMIPLVTITPDGKRKVRWADDYDKVLKKQRQAQAAPAAP